MKVSSLSSTTLYVENGGGGGLGGCRTYTVDPPTVSVEIPDLDHVRRARFQFYLGDSLTVVRNQDFAVTGDAQMIPVLPQRHEGDGCLSAYLSLALVIGEN
jgi:hypothetical protein